ncbi:MAG: hypothetical protein ABIR54_13720 [Burkholderiaceae bacterium]
MHKTAEFALTRDDYRLLQKVTSRRLSQRRDVRPIEWLLKIVAWLMIASTLFVFFKLLDRLPDEAGTLQTLGALLLLGIFLARLALPLALARVRHRLLADHGSFLRPHQLEFRDDALVTRWSTGCAEMQWAGFVDKDEDAKNFYLFVDHCAAYVIPRSAVAGFQADFDRCLERVAPI